MKKTCCDMSSEFRRRGFCDWALTALLVGSSVLALLPFGSPALANPTAPAQQVAPSGIAETEVAYALMGRNFDGFSAQPTAPPAEGGRRPGILLIHDWLGVTDKTKDKVRKWAAEGFVVLAADIYGRGQRPKNPAEAGELSGTFKKDRILFRARLQRGLEELRKMPGVDRNRIAAVGYCFGGTGVIELARAGGAIQAAISFHGGLDSPKPTDGARIKAKILALHGADDPFVPANELAAFEQEMRTHKIDWQLIKYGGAVHSFTDKTMVGASAIPGAAYNLDADRRSWQAAQTFLAEVFKTKQN